MLAITPVKFHSPSFGIFFNNVHNEEGNIRYRGDTVLCRDDLYFPEVVDFLDNKYKNVPKVNVIMHACSDGEEAYSFVGVLISRLKEKALKFLPVKAKDIEPEHLKMAKRGIYNVTETEYLLANASMNGDFYEYFECLPQKNVTDFRLKNATPFKVKDALRNFVNFEQSDILTDSKKTNFKNTVLFARNFWPYLSCEERHKLAKMLANRMDNTSTLIIGDYDKEEANIGALLKMYGFEETKVDNVFEKPKKLIYY